MRKLLVIFVALILALSLLSGCSLLQKLGLKKEKGQEIAPVSSIFISEQEASLLSDKMPVYLYFTGQDNKELRKLIRYIPSSKAKKGGGSLATVLVEELIKGPAGDTGLCATIPSGSKLHSPVIVEKGVATVDFNKSFVKNHPGGKDAEQMTIYSVVNTLTEMKEIQKVVFIVNGKTSKEFKGNFRFDSEFPRTPSLIGDEPAVKETMAEKQEEGQEQEKDKDTFGPGGESEYIEILE